MRLNFVIFGALLSTVSSLSLEASSRRGFFKSMATTAVAVETSSLFSQNANAYERRDVGDENRSAVTAAFNEQAYKTNNRLEQSGFKLDTREEEKAKLSDALSSFSYDASPSGSKKKVGYGNSNTSAAKSE